MGTQTVSEPEDAELLRRSAAGDATAFEALVRRHQASLHRFTSRICGGRDPDDALQEGLLAAWREAGSFRGEATAKTWLFQLLVNSCHRRNRGADARAPKAPLDANREVSPAAEPEAAAAARELSQLVEQVIAGLDEESRTVLLLRDVEGFRGEEVAQILGLTLPAMKSRLHRARLELKAQLERALGHPIEESLR